MIIVNDHFIQVFFFLIFDYFYRMIFHYYTKQNTFFKSGLRIKKTP